MANSDGALESAEAAVKELASKLGVAIDPAMVVRLATQLAGVMFGHTWEDATAAGLERANKLTDLASVDAAGRARR